MLTVCFTERRPQSALSPSPAKKLSRAERKELKQQQKQQQKQQRSAKRRRKVGNSGSAANVERFFELEAVLSGRFVPVHCRHY